MNALLPTFWTCVALVLYTFIGYPLSLFALARMRPRRRGHRIESDAANRPVTVVLVAHNEAANLGRKIENILASIYSFGALRIIVASDASTDATVAIARSYADRNVTVLPFAVRRGKAACLNDAMATVTTDVVILMDVRQRVCADAISSLVRVLQDDSIGAVSGELMFDDDSPTDFSRGVDFYWRYEKFIRAREAQIDSTVGVTGAIYAIRRSCFTNIPEGAILDDVIVPMRAVKTGKRIAFESSAMAFDRPSRDAESERRRKVRTLQGNWQLLKLEPWLLVPWKNRIWWQFVSHKVLRLVAPALLVAIFVSNAVLAGSSRVYFALLLLQIAFYAIPLAARLLPETRLRSILMAPQAFIYLNWFAVRGFWEFLAGRDSHLWR